jgi:hypothetical protein
MEYMEIAVLTPIVALPCISFPLDFQLYCNLSRQARLIKSRLFNLNARNLVKEATEIKLLPSCAVA